MCFEIHDSETVLFRFRRATDSMGHRSGAQVVKPESSAVSDFCANMGGARHKNHVLAERTTLQRGYLFEFHQAKSFRPSVFIKQKVLGQAFRQWVTNNLSECTPNGKGLKVLLVSHSWAAQQEMNRWLNICYSFAAQAQGQRKHLYAAGSWGCSWSRVFTGAAEQSVGRGSKADYVQRQQNAAPEQQVLGLKTRYITRKTCLHRYTTCCIMRWNMLRNNIHTLNNISYRHICKTYTLHRHICII